MKIDKIKTEEKNQINNNIPTDFDLPEITAESESYHDAEIINSEIDNDDDESFNGDSDELATSQDSVESVSNSESPIYMEDEREKSRGILDDKNKPFDPSVHAYPPEKTPSGIWRKLSKSKREKIDPENGKTILATQSNLSCTRDAEKSSHFYDTVHVLAFGKDAKGTDEQLKALKDSFERFYQENGSLDIPPHWELALTCLDHTTEIIKRPSIFERVQVFGVKMYMKFKGVKQPEKNNDEKETEKGGK